MVLFVVARGCRNGRRLELRFSMMRRFATLSAFALTIVLLVMVPLVGALWSAAVVAPASVPTRAEVSKAIDLLEKSHTARWSGDSGETVRAFAERHVVIHLTEETAPWRREMRKAESKHAGFTESRTVLDTAYQAGNIRSRLASGKRGDDPYAGWLMVFKAYEDLQGKYSIFLNFEIERLKRMESRGTLKEYAAKVRLGLPEN